MKHSFLSESAITILSLPCCQYNHSSFVIEPSFGLCFVAVLNKITKHVDGVCVFEWTNTTHTVLWKMDVILRTEIPFTHPSSTMIPLCIDKFELSRTGRVNRCWSTRDIPAYCKCHFWRERSDDELWSVTRPETSPLSHIVLVSLTFGGLVSVC